VPHAAAPIALSPLTPAIGAERPLRPSWTIEPLRPKRPAIRLRAPDGREGSAAVERLAVVKVRFGTFIAEAGQAVLGQDRAQSRPVTNASKGA